MNIRKSSKISKAYTTHMPFSTDLPLLLMINGKNCL